MDYRVNERDVSFVLFEYLQVQGLQKANAFKDFGEAEYRAFLGEALKFARNELAPLNASGDREDCKLENGKVRTPKGYKAAYQAFAQNGFVGLDVPTTYGGMGLPQVVSVAMSEAFVGACVAFSMYPGLTRGAAHLIEAFGEKALAERFVPKMYGGEWAGTMCLTEPQAGSAVGDLKTTATPLADGGYKIKGTKIFISSGDHDLTDNIIHLVLARVDGDVPGTKGISLFVVPKLRVKSDGSLGESNDVTTVNIEHKMGIHGSSTCLLSFGDKDGSVGYLVGERCRGMSYMFQMMNEARLLTGMQGMAIAGTAYEHALGYAKERTQFGSTLIIEYPDVRRNLMIMKSDVEGMRALLYRTAHLIDLARTAETPEAREHAAGLVEVLTPICKAYCSDHGFRVTELAMQVYGGYGYCAEYPAEQYMRDVKISSIYEGANGIQAMDLVGRKLPMKGGQPFQSLYAMIDAFCSAQKAHSALSGEVAVLKKAVDGVAQIAMKFMELGMAKDQNYVLLSATPFLAACGDVILAYLLLDQAVLAESKRAGASGQDAAFYDAKVKTAKFFAQQILPQVTARAKAILSLDRSALDIAL